MSNQREQQKVAADGDTYRHANPADSQLQSVFDKVQIAIRDELMKHGTRASLLQARSTEQQRILRSTRVDINVVLETVQGTQNPSHNLLHPARDIQSRADSHLKCNFP